MQIPLQQTKKWQKLQQDLGEKTYFEETPDYTYLAIEKPTKLGTYLYLPYGPYLGTKSGAKKVLESLKKLAEEKSAIFIRIEPQDAKNAQFLLNLPNCRKSTNLNPKETWVLDISKEDFAAKIPSRLTRYHRGATKKSLKITTSKNPEDIKYLTKLQNALADQKNIQTFPEKYLKTELKQSFSTLYLVEYQTPDTKKSDIVAAGLVFDDGDTRYNLQGAQNDEGRKLHATGILTVQLILDAKEKGLKIFDFWGIAPENAKKNHPWAGFTNFKKTFDGYEVDYAGTYDIIFDKSKYRLYQMLRKANRLKRKIKK